jgi:hypothetical protein
MTPFSLHMGYGELREIERAFNKQREHGTPESDLTLTIRVMSNLQPHVDSRQYFQELLWHDGLPYYVLSYERDPGAPLRLHDNKFVGLCVPFRTDGGEVVYMESEASAAYTDEELRKTVDEFIFYLGMRAMVGVEQARTYYAEKGLAP